jgi:hypothetical protein
MLLMQTVGSQMAVRLSVSRPGRPLPPGGFLVLISVRGLADPGAIMRLEGLGQLTETLSSGIERRPSGLQRSASLQLPATVDAVRVAPEGLHRLTSSPRVHWLPRGVKQQEREAKHPA